MEKKKYIITSGCSFTAHCVEPNIAWPNHLGKSYEVVNCSEMASGNALISRNVIATIPNYLDKQPTIIVMWTNPNRFELFFNQDSPNYQKIFDAMENNSGFQNQPLTGKWETHTKSNWLKSGGGFGHWRFESRELNRLMQEYLLHYHNEEYQFIETLEHILRVQWYCKAHNLKLINVCWQDIFTGMNSRNGNNSTEQGEPLANKFENSLHLWELIDWNTWWFHKSYGGLKEWCTDNGYEQFPGSHPTTEAQKDFANNVVLGLLND